MKLPVTSESFRNQSVVQKVVVNKEDITIEDLFMIKKWADSKIEAILKHYTET